MALFFPDDPNTETYENGRPVGFTRYKEMIGDHWLDWMRAGFITTAALIPLYVAVTVSIAASSILLLIPLSFIGGMIYGPFYSALHDVILRGMRFASGTWWEQYRTGLKQNWKSSLLPGGVFGVLAGAYTFMAFLMYWRVSSIPLTTIVMYFISGLILIALISVYMPLHVLFDQTFKNRLINIIAYTSSHLWKVLGVSVLQMVVLTITIMLAPWTLLLVPVLGWYFRFAVIHQLYDSLNEFFRIEELIAEKENQKS